MCSRAMFQCPPRYQANEGGLMRVGRCFFCSYRFQESDTVLVTAGSVPQGGFVQPATDVYVFGLRAHYTF